MYFIDKTWGSISDTWITNKQYYEMNNANSNAVFVLRTEMNAKASEIKSKAAEIKSLYDDFERRQKLLEIKIDNLTSNLQNKTISVMKYKN